MLMLEVQSPWMQAILTMSTDVYPKVGTLWNGICYNLGMEEAKAGKMACFE